jgi:GAF domain-containing protein
VTEPSAVARRSNGCDDVHNIPAELLAELGCSLDPGDVGASLARVCVVAVGTVEGAQFAGIVRTAGNRQIAGCAATDPLVETVDRLQSDTRDGPSVAAIHDQRIVRIVDLSREQRWPLFTPRAAEIGIRSMLALRVTVGQRGWGALTLYSTNPGVFGPLDEVTGLLLASYAAVPVADAQHQQHLRAGLNSRDLIGQAKGVLMERYQIDQRKAFALLVRLSQDNNRRLIDIADRVVHTGEDPTDAVARLPRRD